MEGTPGAPPTCGAISLGLLASFHALIPDSFGPQNSPLRSCSTASPDGAPAFPPAPQKTFQIDSLRTLLLAALNRAGPTKPRHPFGPAPQPAPTRVFTFSFPCQLSLSLWPFSDAEHLGSLASGGLQLLALSHSLRSGPVLMVLSAHRLESPAQSGASLRAAG